MRGEQLTASDASVLGISPGEALSLRVRNGKLVRIVKTNALGMPSATRTACQNIHCAEGRCCWCTAFEVPPDCWCDACDIISSPGPGN